MSIGILFGVIGVGVKTRRIKMPEQESSQNQKWTIRESLQVQRKNSNFMNKKISCDCYFKKRVLMVTPLKGILLKLIEIEEKDE